jgi:hypothetical protein
VGNFVFLTKDPLLTFLLFHHSGVWGSFFIDETSEIKVKLLTSPGTVKESGCSPFLVGKLKILYIAISARRGIVQDAM